MNEYKCDRCGEHTPDGDGIYYKGERYCPNCAEIEAFWETVDETCLNCGATDHDDVQEGLCADCFRAMPAGEWVTAGTWNQDVRQEVSK